MGKLIEYCAGIDIGKRFRLGWNITRSDVAVERNSSPDAQHLWGAVLCPSDSLPPHDSPAPLQNDLPGY
jgi:hypothetical protein